MNPLTRALKLAEDPQPEAAAPMTDRSGDRTPGGLGELRSMRATRHDPTPRTLPPAAIAFGDSSGPEIPDAARLAPLRATRDDSDREILPPTAPAIGQAHGLEIPDAAPLAPLRATKDRAVVDTTTHGADFAAAEAPDPSPATLGGVPSDSAGTAASDAAATRAVDRDVFRSLPRSRSFGRGIGIVLSMLAAAGAAAGGGAFLWKTELARPALVGGLPPLHEVAVEPAPVHAGNVAGGGPREPAEGAAPASHDTPAVFAAAPDNGIPPDRPAGAAGSGDPAGLSAVAEKNEGLPMLAAAPRGEGHPTPSAVAPGSGEPPALRGAAPGSESPPILPAAAPGGSRYPAPSTAPSGSEGLPSGRTAAPAPGRSSTGLPAPETTGEARGLPAGHDAPEAKRDDAAAVGSGARIAIMKRTRADHVAESLGRAYEAYLAGDGEAAGQAYRSVLRHEPRNRDALLGLAAVAAQADRRDEAAEHYATLLASHPIDTAARAALIVIGEEDPARAESRLKALLRIEPEAAHLHFSLGNLYAAESRWPEAQQSWFRAYRLERDNADHAYNLAVGLDHLSQSRNALELYREALVLARSARASFEAEAVRKRIRALESRADAERRPDDPSEEAGAAATVHVR